MTKEELCSLIDRERLVSDYGKTTVDRALEYVGKVQKMRLCSDGSVLATINGSASYVTRVKVKDDGGFDDQCTCPVGYGCKHAAALALAWNKKVAKGEKVAKLSKLDDRIEAVLWKGERRHYPQKGSEDWVEFEAREAVREAISTPGRDYAWEEYEKRNWHSWEDDDDEGWYEDEDGNWHDVDEYVGPNYRKVKKIFEQLKEEGRVKALTALANELIDGTPPQIKHADDGDEIAYDVMECLKVARSAVWASALTAAKKTAFCRRIAKWKEECL